MLTMGVRTPVGIKIFGPDLLEIERIGTALLLLDYNMNIAVWVGFIALAGAAAETSAVMLGYLDGAYRERRQAERLRTLDDLIDMVQATAVERVRQMILIGLTNILAMFPVMWSTGTGAGTQRSSVTRRAQSPGPRSGAPAS